MASSTPIIVLSKRSDLPLELSGVQVITAREYLTDAKYLITKNLKIYNLCSEFAYQSTGYYVSLLAQARDHKVSPDVTTIQDTKTQSVMRFQTEELADMMRTSFRDVVENEFTLYITFGTTLNPKMANLGSRIATAFDVPLLVAYFTRKKTGWVLTDVDPLGPKALPKEERTSLPDTIETFFNNKKRKASRTPSGRKYDLAILVNPDEKTAPSDRIALRRFAKAAIKSGLRPTYITRAESAKIENYDALFLRETTAVNHHTYRIARKANLAGLVVIDEPEAIVKCSNKVYLAELMGSNGVDIPKTFVLHKDNLDMAPRELGYPLILKLPDSCFSQGVEKAKTPEDYQEKCARMLAQSDLIIAQEFLPTPFDWRIGIMGDKPIYACKYYMAGGHWQITNWEQKAQEKDGGSTAHNFTEVPPEVMTTALRATQLLGGTSLYGVDVKEIDGKAYLVEVNDNPSIDSGIEDAHHGQAVYDEIMDVFYKRIKAR